MRKSAFPVNFAAGVSAALAAITLVALPGCGGSPGTPGTQAAGAAKSSATSLPTASIGSAAQAGANAANSPLGQEDAKTELAAPAKAETPEDVLAHMIDLRAAPLPEAPTAEARSSLLRERNEKLVNLAHEVISKTHQDKTKEALFNGAVHFLVESRLQLATGGSEDDARALLEDAKALSNRDPNSVAAGEAGYAIVRLAATNARLHKNDPGFVQEFAVQARLFSNHFPQYEAGAVQPQLLSSAARACEQCRLDSEAISCYALLQEKYPKNPQAEQAKCCLRRLELKGKPLAFGGETRDKSFLRIKQFHGRPVLIVFWSSESDHFQGMLPQLKQTISAYQDSGLAVIGVCVDETEEAFDAFVKKNRVEWPQIFYSDPNQRHWDTPVVKYYGITDIPTLWLVNANGIIVDTHVTPDSLGGQLKSLLAARSQENPE